jgi:hypothetical protein
MLVMARLQTSPIEEGTIYSHGSFSYMNFIFYPLELWEVPLSDTSVFEYMPFYVFLEWNVVESSNDFVPKRSQYVSEHKC